MKELHVERLHQVLAVLHARVDNGGYLSARGSGGEGEIKGCPAARISSSMQEIAVEGVQKTVIRSTAAGREILRRTGDGGAGLLRAGAGRKEGGEAVEPGRVR